MSRNKNPFYRPPEIKHHEISNPECLVSFMVGGRAVPWKVPDVRISRRGGSYTEKNEKLCTWQDNVRTEARAAWGNGRPAYEGPVGIAFQFYVHPPCRRALKTADLTNLIKSTEDGLQGSVIKNDTQVFAHYSERIFIPEHELQHVNIEVWATPREWPVPERAGEFGFRPWEWGLAPVESGDKSEWREIA
jgi:Holliday junction resolvase RusA-like endonuclease